MRRVICIFLLLTLMVSLAACQLPGQEASVPFYFLRTDFEYGTEDGVIAPEQREVSGREDDLKYMLALYLEGPLDPAYTSPFPKNIRILDLLLDDDMLTIELSEEFAVLSDVDLTLACACIARTCFALSDAEQVVIIALSDEYGNKSVTLDQNSLILMDDSAARQTTAPERAD